MTYAWHLPPMRLRLFGKFHLERNTQTIHLITRKAELLLAYLVLHPEPHSRDQLATLLWGDFPDDQARASLRNALASIRKCLGKEIIFADRETIQFDPHPSLWIDVRAFQEMVANPDNTYTMTNIEKWQAAIDLYRGDLLADCCDDWLIPPREQLRATYIDLLLQLAQWWRTRSEYAKANDYAHRILVVDPTNEKAHQNIIVNLIALGERSAACKQYKECERLLRVELGVEPSLETRTLYEWINQREAKRTAAESLLTNLPVRWLDFVGRKTECVEIERLIRHHRLVTLIGVGGCGKTSLALQVARQLVNAFRDGAWWADLAPLDDEAMVAPTIAAALGVRESAQQTLENALADYLRDKHLLLLLDGCDHVVDACASLVAMFLSRCAQVHILTTGREALGITGEVLWHVPPLSVPDPKLYWNAATKLPNVTSATIDALMRFDAVQLFVQRAALLNPNFVLNSKNAFAVAEICRRLDGIPLAIELAAARTRTMSVSQIADRLGDRFRLLTRGHRTALPQHQTMQAAIDWSYDALSDRERMLFRRVACFLGGWTLEAAEHVAADKDTLTMLAPVEILDALTRLVTKSLIEVDTQSHQMRYRMLETLREYARQKLIDSGEAVKLFTRHRDWFLRYAEDAERELRRAEQILWLDRLEADYENLRAALRYSFRRRDRSALDLRKGLHLTAALLQFWAMRGMLKEGRLWLKEALHHYTDLPKENDRELELLHAKLLNGAGVLAYVHGDLKQAGALCEQSLTLARRLENRWLAAVCLYVLSERERHWHGDYERALAWAQEGLALAHAEDDPWLVACMLMNVGSHVLAQGEYSQAQTHFEEGVQLAEQVGDQWIASALLEGLGQIAYAQGDCVHAIALYERGLAMRRALKDKNGIAGLLNNLGRAVYCQGDWARARELFQASLELCRELEQRESMAWVQHNLARVELKLGKTMDALHWLASSLGIWRELWNRSGLVDCLVGIAITLSIQGRFEVAARLFGAAQMHYKGISITIAPTEQAEFEEHLRQTRTALGKARFHKFWRQGRAMSLQEIMDYTLCEISHT